jgi:transcriptional regulator with XRE-family HTH domain
MKLADQHTDDVSTVDAPYWSRLTRQLRQGLCQSQEQFAATMGTNQATVSRWETGANTPSYEARQRLVRMTGELGLAMLDELADVVRVSPFWMVLADRSGVVVAASASSGFSEGRGTLEQTPTEERDSVKAFERSLAQSGFWDGQGRRTDYRFHHNGEVRTAVVMPVTIKGDVYALVQRCSEPTHISVMGDDSSQG